MYKIVMQEFLDDRELRNLSKHTLKSYKEILKRFESFCVNKGIFDTDKVTSKVAKEFFVYCKHELKNSISTINEKNRTLKVYFKYLEEGIVEENPFKKIKFSKEDTITDVLTDE
ncbi:tyrosine-type recombinase/integrase [Bacillus cereus]|uniref:tyrosine-type recombinase/integrase n=2 Tax=Bacillaceae TaxID=186817 RepID=UPI000AA24B82|nr:phage integrase SAM-like domain-containing protein [Bacillus cereus]MCO4215059.1 phage integrase SAM-like domain-containing protein [Bacillus sp. 10017]